jgi:hypothetical protein
MRLVVLPEARVPGPDPLNRPLVVEPAQRLAIGVPEAAEREPQATLIAFSFSAIAFSSES